MSWRSSAVPGFPRYGSGCEARPQNLKELLKESSSPHRISDHLVCNHGCPIQLRPSLHGCVLCGWVVP